MNETPGEAAAILAQGSAALESLFGRLTPEMAEARGTIGGGAWSARDLAGHIETWEQVALRTIEELRAGRRPSIRETVTDAASMDRFNAAEVERKAGRGWEDTLAGFREVNATLVGTVRAVTDGEWAAVPAGQQDDARTLGEHVGSATGMPKGPFRHAWAHLGDLEAFVHRNP
ncbi:MAG TPA: DinB family protein [Actinomycetota bacterium]|nr:DinB family protein [Actinomycetota bacterium]